ncbi:putative endonuclease-reverse transcriptase [Trichonephila clavata]|uniref:Putative endonuclease-reverse transcriptase n=1 Tax=Trichonephila clavata TaxID=2740835 RepID=A0A8X6IM12_TRICU|nr:putative endonuclease-reverse transcriptase [Trichonephila clavata]
MKGFTKRLFYEELLKDAEHLKSSNESRVFYKIINNSRKDFKSRVTICRNSDGEILSNPTEISQRWVEYFSDLLNAAHTNKAVFVPHQNYQDIQVPPPDCHEVELALQTLKSNKASGALQTWRKTANRTSS